MTRTDIEGLKRGERAAQELFLRRHAERVFSLIIGLVGNTQDAEELTQDVLLKALNHIDTFDERRASLTTWVSRIAYHAALNHLRQPSLPTISLDDNNYGVSDDIVNDALMAADNDTTELLRMAIEQLPPSEQALVNMFYYDDLPLKDIAYIVEAPPGNIATHLYRIRKKLYLIIQKLKRQ